MADPASGAAGLPAPASLGANAGSLSAMRLASSSGAAGVSYGWDGRGSATLRLDPSGSLSSALSFGPTGAVDSGAVGELSLLGWDGEDVLPAAGLVFLRARWMLAAEGVFASADLFLGAAGVPATLNRRAFGLGDPVNRFDPSGRSSIFSGVAHFIKDRLNSVAKPPVLSRVMGAIGYVASEARSAMDGARAAGGSEWVVTRAGYVAASIAARYCGSASYMMKGAPIPNGTRQTMTALGALGSAVGLDGSTMRAVLEISRALSSSSQSAASGPGLSIEEMPKNVGRLFRGMEGIGVAAGILNTIMNAAVALGDENVSFERQISNAMVEIGLGLSVTFIPDVIAAAGTLIGSVVEPGGGTLVGSATGATAGTVAGFALVFAEGWLRERRTVDEWKEWLYKDCWSEA